MLDKVKLSLRVTTDAFDEEITDLIQAALLDLGIAGVTVSEVNESSDTSEGSEAATGENPASEEPDPLILRAVITYCKAHFGEPEQYERFKAAYDEQMAQLRMATGYTDWGET